jgi:uncharacterized membrane protein
LKEKNYLPNTELRHQKVSWPVVAFVLSVLFLGETLTVRKGLGIFLVVLGAAFLR